MGSRCSRSLQLNANMALVEVWSRHSWLAARAGNFWISSSPARLPSLLPWTKRRWRRREEKCDPLTHRLAKVFWRGSYERSLPISDDKLFGADEMVELATRIIEKKGEEGNCVIVGRGAPYILRNRKDTFRVFVYGSREEKIRRMVKLKMEEKYAEEMVDTIDRERAAFIRKYFNAEWPCRRLYHMMLNSDQGIELVADTILATMESLERQPQAAR